ncbi:MAG: tetratricopeptide repeat protein [Nitrospiraceae bacterium]|nr:tetratricopeptide repeat protein [Nitrospiraceae bacterium]
MSPKLSAELSELFSHYIEEHLGLYFSRERANDLDRALIGVSAELGFQDPESCVRSLLLSAAGKAQIEVLASHLTVGETYFFRDKKSFDVLKDRILPDLIQSRRQTGRKNLRIWSAGCATGEEPYSVAILLGSMIHDIEEWDISIIGTDINPSFLRKAAKGVYGEWSFRNVPSRFKERFFKEAGKGRFELLPEIRKCVHFFYHNLAEDTYPSLINSTNAMDIIFCRNVLMYFTEASKRKVAGKFYHCLVDGGWLMVSPAESSLEQYSPFSQVHFSESAPYRKGAAKCETGPAENRAAEKGEPEGAEQLAEEQLTEGRLAEGRGQAGTASDGNVPRPIGSPGVPDVRPPVPESACPPAVAAALRAEAEDTYAEAFKLYESGRYAEAQEKVAPLASGGGNASALALLARIHANRGRLTDALDYCRRAIAADRLNPAYRYLLSAILLEMGREDESKTCLGRALYLDQDFALAHFALGNLARRRGMKRQSERHFKNALSILRACRPDNIVAESEGITAERMIEIIMRTIREEALA